LDEAVKKSVFINVDEIDQDISEKTCWDEKRCGYFTWFYY
jgi:hypothetical protein